jgi:transposase-like protein
MENEIACKHCNSEAVVKFGTYKGAQRYWCKSCQRKFKAGDTLFHMKTPTNQVSSALNSYYEGMSIKAIRGSVCIWLEIFSSRAILYSKALRGGV